MQKKIALINDVTGFGRCSIAVMAPIVSAMKIQAVTVPTAILSAHTQFPEYYFDDYTSKMTDYIETYKKLQLSFDAIATGFLGSMEQVEIVINFIKNFKNDNNFILVDPVMGDYGKLYQTYTPQMCEKMKELVQYADIITPNLTELCTLLDYEYPRGKITLDMLHEMCKELAKKGPKHIVVTGINLNQTQIANYIYDTDLAESGDDDFRIVMVDRIGGDRSGTGDVISSIIAGMYMNGYSVYDAVKKAADFVSKCIRYCEENKVPNHYGLCFEMFMNELVNL
ncbi:MAG: pyridoxamine kinase [Lachnospiraceae bacterium]|nr:pyridoxamine kinase [Lachnospiraceae bacterium]